MHMKKNKAHLHQNVCVVSYLSNNGKMCLQKNNIFFFCFQSRLRFCVFLIQILKLGIKNQLQELREGVQRRYPIKISNSSSVFFKRSMNNENGNIYVIFC